MIALGCPQCGAQLRVKDDLAGRRGKCPKCQAAIVVPPGTPTQRQAAGQPAPVTASTAPAERRAPQPTQTAPSAPRKSDPREVLNKLSGHIAPVRTSPGYKGAVLLVAIVMLVLPLVYVAMIAGVAALVYLHAVSNTWIVLEMKGRGGRGSLVLVALYLAPLIAGGILLFFMCKPLFAKSGKRDKPRSLTRTGEPLLFEFVDRLCEVLGAPAPTRIDVDCQINASASFRRGLVSLFGKDMVLTVGLPLVAGLNLQEFAGVLAHEFGHFSQGWGLRLSYIIRVISHWFTRVVYERDAWDEWLVAAANRWDWRISIILQLARLFVWLTRKVLWVLMMIGHAMSGLLLRQMEFDADLHEVRLGGSTAFETTCRQLTVLNVASAAAYGDLQQWYRESRLSDDLPWLIRFKAEVMPPVVRSRLNHDIDESKTGWLDTHPADSERIARAQAAAEQGLFHDTRPASELFANFRQLSKIVTFDLYKFLLGSAIKITDLHSADELVERQEKENAAGAALARYLLGQFHPLRPLPIGTGWIDGKQDAKTTAARLQQARKALLAALPAYEAARAAWLDANAVLSCCELAEAMLAAGFKIKPDTFPQPLTSKAQVRSARERAQVALARASTACEPFESAARERMLAALEGINDPAIAARLPSSDALEARCRVMLTSVTALGRLMPRINELRSRHATANLLTQQLSPSTTDEALVGAIRDQMRPLHRLISDILEQLARFEYPFKHGRGKRSIAAYCTETTPIEQDLASLLMSGGDLLDRIFPLLERLMGQLSIAAENVEKVLRLRSLEPGNNAEEVKSA